MIRGAIECNNINTERQSNSAEGRWSTFFYGGSKTGPEEDKHEKGNILRKEGIRFTGSFLFICKMSWNLDVEDFPNSVFSGAQVCRRPNRRKATRSMVRLKVVFPKVGKPVIMESKVIRNYILDATLFGCQENSLRNEKKEQ